MNTHIIIKGITEYNKFILSFLYLKILLIEKIKNIIIPGIKIIQFNMKSMKDLPPPIFLIE